MCVPTANELPIVGVVASKKPLGNSGGTARAKDRWSRGEVPGWERRGRTSRVSNSENMP
jgi:hypothetical protein